MREQVIRVFLLSHLHGLFLDYGKDVEVSEMLTAEMEAASRIDSNDHAVIAMDYNHEFGIDFFEVDKTSIDDYKLLKQELERHELFEECAALKRIRNNITDSVALR